MLSSMSTRALWKLAAQFVNWRTEQQLHAATPLTRKERKAARARISTEALLFGPEALRHLRHRGEVV